MNTAAVFGVSGPSAHSFGLTSVAPRTTPVVQDLGRVRGGVWICQNVIKGLRDNQHVTGPGSPRNQSFFADVLPSEHVERSGDHRDAPLDEPALEEG